ncbi:DUF397 domain-containing protein [Amycolatopsis balhimycina DSM 5908]|uniref:DUF397 domain-containing protein n=1 Tax=Amycolatopsis balhimycina DSM 5908 TaxID=1081091 RepID=A0A428WSK8_AMYBA|nr:DUF397 domain-containing protein [Amycolatopsis balhimycina]RSM46063.1 DUF397 domain-containing protein [Amycolatopsis balhimycina DSM 5908]
MDKFCSYTAASHRSDWFKSSHSNASGSCVEVRFASGCAAVRDSKNRCADSPVIEFPPASWTSFLRAVGRLTSSQ